MGRKKRKVIVEEPAPQHAIKVETTTTAPPPAIVPHPNVHPRDPRGPAISSAVSKIAPSTSTVILPSHLSSEGIPPPTIKQDDVVTAPPAQNTSSTSSIQIKSATIAKNSETPEDYIGSVKAASQYGLHSHSGDLIPDDMYVSDGSDESDDDDDDDNGEKNPIMELVMTTSKTGLMRRGGISSLFDAPSATRTWVRPGSGGDTKDQDDTAAAAAAATEKEETTEEEEANLDPAQRLALQHRKIEAAKQTARTLESSENAGRDPCLFSKRTAFDIRMDQIEEKPWDKGESDMTDYFNYGMMEDDWVGYAERQLAVRQELTDASKQKRLPDPGIVTVVPRAPRVQGDRVAVRKKEEDGDDDDEEEMDEEEKDEAMDDGEDVGPEIGVALGPLHEAVKGENSSKEQNDDEVNIKKEEVGVTQHSSTTSPVVKQEKVIGGAWGAGAAKDSVLLRLIQEQSGGGPDRSSSNASGTMPPTMGGHHPMMSMPPPNIMGGMPLPPPPSARNGAPPHYNPSPQKQEQYKQHGNEGDGGHYGDAGQPQWKRDQNQNNNFHSQGASGGAYQQQHQQQPPHHHNGRGFQQQQQQQQHQQGYNQQQQQQGYNQHHHPPPGQYHRGGQGAPPPHNTYQQGPVRGGGNNNGGYHDQRGGGHAPPNNNHGPPPHGNWENNHNRPRNDYGRGGDSRRGRW